MGGGTWRLPNCQGVSRAYDFRQPLEPTADTIPAMVNAAVKTGSALLARIGLQPKTLSAAGRVVSESLKTHGAAIGTAATVASLVPTSSKRVVVQSAAQGSEANTYLARYGAATS